MAVVTQNNRNSAFVTLSEGVPEKQYLLLSFELEIVVMLLHNLL